MFSGCFTHLSDEERVERRRASWRKSFHKRKERRRAEIEARKTARAADIEAKRLAKRQAIDARKAERLSRRKDAEGKRLAVKALWAVNREKYKAAEKARRAADPEKHREAKRREKHVRHARLCGSGAGNYTPKELADLRKKAGGRCAMCRAKARLTIDHIIAIASGGTNLISNIQFLCAPCNSTKRDLPPEVFARSLGLLL